MRILIATASRHGATREIGQWLGASILREMSTDVSFRRRLHCFRSGLHYPPFKRSRARLVLPVRG